MKMNSGHRARLWDRLQKTGLNAGFVQSYEKLEILLMLIIPRKDTKALAKRLIERYKSLQGVVFAPYESLVLVPGVGPKTARYINMLGDFCKAIQHESLPDLDLLDSPKAVRTFLRQEIGWEESEYFVGLYLNTKNKLITYQRLFRGTIDRSAVYPREIIKEALAYNAKCLILAHNHPSGDPNPSREDIRITQKIMESLSQVGMTLQDHLVVGKEAITSLRETYPHLWLQNVTQSG